MIFYIVLIIIAVLFIIVVWKQTNKTSGKINCFDENVQFSVFRPETISPEQWYPMLVFTHLSERRGQNDKIEPLEEVKRQAHQILGEQFDDFKTLRQDSSEAIPPEGQITLVPSAQGIEFNPERRTFKWVEDVHREEFRLRAQKSKDDKTIRGNVTVFLGSILLADITLVIHVDSASTIKVDKSSFLPIHGRPYRRIFASYSHKDSAIVDQFEHHARAIGDRYYRDIDNLRSGEIWNKKLSRLIEQSDVFQLFWSSNSMHSSFVKQEWQYALSLNRNGFVRPTYWEVPFPESSHERLPPDELRQLHFQRIVMERPEGQKVEQIEIEENNRSAKNRIGLYAAFLVPILAPLMMFPFFSPMQMRRITFLNPYALEKESFFSSLLNDLWILLIIFSALSMFILPFILFAREFDKLWSILLRPGKKFWLLATLFFSVMFSFSVLPLHQLIILKPLSVWLSYAWIRWIFLPFLNNNRG
jgi:hypothetical protein